MNATDLFLFFNRWLIRELLNAVLRPMFVRLRLASIVSDDNLTAPSAAAARYQRLFDRLLFSCDCYPFCVEVDRCGLWILDEPSDQDDFGFGIEDAA